MKQQKKKPTAKEIEQVISKLIVENQRNQLAIIRTQQVLSDYIEFKKDDKKFTKYVEEKDERANNDNKKSPSKK